MITLVASIRFIGDTLEDIDPDRPAGTRSRFYSPEEQEIVVNVYKYVETSSSESRMSSSDASENTEEPISRKRRAFSRKLRHQRKRDRRITDVVDLKSLNEIRKKIYYFFHEIGHGVPTAENILREVNEDESLPNFTMPTFRRILRHVKYRHSVTRCRDDPNAQCETFSMPVLLF